MTINWGSKCEGKLKRYYLGMQGLPSWCSRQQEVGWGYHVKPFCCHGFDLKPSLVQLKGVWDILTKSVEWNACSTCCAGADLAVRRSRTAVALLRIMNFYWYDVSLLFFTCYPSHGASESLNHFWNSGAHTSMRLQSWCGVFGATSDCSQSQLFSELRGYFK